MKPEWQRFLSRRSTMDKVAVCIDCDLCDPADLPVIAELVREGIVTWIDRTLLMQVAVRNRDGSFQMTKSGMVRRPNVDVYKLTEKGIALCDAEGITQH